MSAVSVFVRPRAHARHAKPSKAAPAIVAGGLTMAFAVTDGLALSSSASAGGSTAQFERLAQCESGGNWSINTGNGYYGGLQFNLGTWRGLGFGGYPHEASKATQIAAGQKLQGQRGGWSAWPACSRNLGLSGDGGNSSDGGSAASDSATSAPAERTQAPRVTSADRREAANRASRSRTATKATQVAAAKARADRVAAIRALTPTAAPRFDGHVLSVADAGTNRIAVKHWQRRMAARGWSISVDGRFGPQSAAVARSFAVDKKVSTGPGTVDAQLWSLAWTAPVTL